MSHLFCIIQEGYEADIEEDDDTDKAVVTSPAVSFVERPVRQRHRERHRRFFHRFSDKVLVEFGTMLGVLCGPKDFVSFARTCRRMYRLLMLSPDVVSSVIEMRLAYFVSHPPKALARQATRAMYSLWSTATRITTLEQVALYEELYGWGMLNPWKNRIHFAPLKAGGHDRIAWSCGAMSEGGNFQINVIWEILKSHPKVSVHCDVHGSPLMSDDMAMKATVIYGEIFLEDLAGSEFAGRISYSPWGKRATQNVQSHSLQEEEEMLGVIVVEFYFRMRTPTGGIMEFPQRRQALHKGIYPGGYERNTSPKATLG
jgi:hypothetical protein